MSASLFQDKLAFFMHDGLQAEAGESIFANSSDLPRVAPAQLIRLRSQADAHQQFFMQHALDYFDGMGLMCICRLNFRTICAAAVNLALGRRVS